MVNIDLTNRKALVTGGARGIGASLVRVLAECGASVAFTHLALEKDIQAAEELANSLSAKGHQLDHYIAPAEEVETMEQVVSACARKMGGLDILIPNVGVNWISPLEKLEIDSWKRALDLNLTCSFIAIKTAHPWLVKASRADVVLIGSSAVFDGGGGGAHYAAAKAGLEGLMVGLMRELPRKGIHINLIHPCVVDTDLLRERYDDAEKRLRLAAQVPVGRLARPEDIAYLAAFLCSELGGFICGQSILVDGGRTLWRNT
jgi:3-oxoacyl-[acyl-carrier protein] reductase